MKHFQNFLFFWLVLTASILCGKINKSEPIFQSHDLWYEVFLGEMKAGYAHDTMSQEGGLIKSRNEMVIQIKRVGQVVEIQAEQNTVEKLSGELVEFSTETKMAGIPMIKKGRVDGTELVVYERQFIKGKENRYPFDPAGRMSWGLQKEVLEKGFKKAGTNYTIKIYSPDISMRSAVPALIELHGKKRLSHGGSQIDAYVVVITIKS